MNFNLKPSDKITLIAVCWAVVFIAGLLWIGLHWILAVIIGMALAEVVRMSLLKERARRKIIDSE